MKLTPLMLLAFAAGASTFLTTPAHAQAVISPGFQNAVLGVQEATDVRMLDDKKASKDDVEAPKDKPKRSKSNPNDGKDGAPNDGNAGGGNTESKPAQR